MSSLVPVACIVRCWDRHEQSGVDDRMPEKKPHEQTRIGATFLGTPVLIAQERFPPVWADLRKHVTCVVCARGSRNGSRVRTTDERIPKL